MIIELNIGLNVANGENTPAACNARSRRAFSLISNTVYCSNILASRRAESVSEDTLIAQLQISSGCEKKAQREIALISELLQQDCIAWYNATDYTGALLGPNAAAWGEFNPDYFIRYGAARTALILSRNGQGQDALINQLAAQRDAA